AVGPLPMLPPQALLRAPRENPTVIPREVTGEILRDAEGKLYERVGDRVRPVRQLFAGARGEMIDLLPARPMQGHPRAEADVQPSAAANVDATSTAPEQPRERAFRELARRLAPEPGFWRIVRYADFIDVLGPQLNAAARLQPGHQLACYLQVFEVCVQTSQP